MAAMCSESKPWTLRSLSLPLVSYMTLANSARECECRAGTAIYQPLRGLTEALVGARDCL